MRSKIDKLQWNMIVDRFYERRCVPFLGAGANISRENPAYQGLPLGGEVAWRIGDELKYTKNRAMAAGMARIALEYELRSDRGYLLDFLMKAVPDEQRIPSPLLETLAKLPLGLVVTTNYDRLLERALQSEGRQFELLVQPIGGFEDIPATWALFDKLEHDAEIIVYKIHGSFGHDPETGGAPERAGPPRVIITEDDYIEFLAVHEKESERIGVPKIIRSKLIPSTLLFLGYGLQDWDFRTIYRGLVGRLNKHDRRASFAIQKNPPRYWVKYWESQGIEIFNMDAYQFAEQLTARYFEKYPRPI
jgi:hypothetical protein